MSSGSALPRECLRNHCMIPLRDIENRSQYPPENEVPLFEVFPRTPILIPATRRWLEERSYSRNEKIAGASGSRQPRRYPRDIPLHWNITFHSKAGAVTRTIISTNYTMNASIKQKHGHLNVPSEYPLLHDSHHRPQPHTRRHRPTTHKPPTRT